MLIIEDETIIAHDIKSIVESLGHQVVRIARTRSEATAMTTELHPVLILAGISLADGSSGIGAVNEIMVHDDLPVIFIAAFPERLLTDWDADLAAQLRAEAEGMGGTPLTSRSEGRLLDESAKVKVALRAVTVETPGD